MNIYTHIELSWEVAIGFMEGCNTCNAITNMNEI